MNEEMRNFEEVTEAVTETAAEVVANNCNGMSAGKAVGIVAGIIALVGAAVYGGKKLMEKRNANKYIVTSVEDESANNEDSTEEND